MRKQIIIAVTAVLVAVVACFTGGRYYLLNNKTDEQIISIEIPPFSDDIVLYEGESAYEEFFEVIYENGFSVNDIDFVSENESIAKIKYTVTDRNRYVCYKVTALSVGETFIYFSADEGKTVSDKIKVKVLPKKNSSEPQVDVTEAEETQITTQVQEIASVTDEYATEQESTDIVVTTDFDIVSEKVTQVHSYKETVASTENDKVQERETTQKSAENNKGNTVYVAPTGKRYHYSKSCAGKNAYAVDKSQAISGGKTPCKKCAGG